MQSLSDADHLSHWFRGESHHRSDIYSILLSEDTLPQVSHFKTERMATEAQWFCQQPCLGYICHGRECRNLCVEIMNSYSINYELWLCQVDSLFSNENPSLIPQKTKGFSFAFVSLQTALELLVVAVRLRLLRTFR